MGPKVSKAIALLCNFRLMSTHFTQGKLTICKGFWSYFYFEVGDFKTTRSMQHYIKKLNPTNIILL